MVQKPTPEARLRRRTVTYGVLAAVALVLLAVVYFSWFGAAESELDIGYTDEASEYLEAIEADARSERAERRGLSEPGR